MWNSFTPWYFIFTEETFNRITWRVISFRHEPVSMWLCVASISSASPQICGPEIFLFECWSLSSQNYKKNYITANEIITARKRSCGKVLFLHLCVILLTGGSLSMGSGVSVQGGSLSGRPPYGTEWAIRILLECILVVILFWIELRPFHSEVSST